MERTHDSVRGESGFSLIEALVAIVLLSIVGLASARNSIMSMSTLKRSMRNSIATQLAIEKLEELGSIDPVNLDATDNSIESALTQDNITFRRTTTVVVNADQSRSITILVEANDEYLGGAYTAMSRFSLWGNT